MYIEEQESRSILYEVLLEMGLLCTEDYSIRTYRDADALDDFKIHTIEHTDVDRVSYVNGHFNIDIDTKDEIEIWAGDRYLNPMELTWIEYANRLFGMLPSDCRVDTVKIMPMENVVSRHTNYHKDDDTEKTHVFTVDITKSPYVNMPNPSGCVYYISNSQLHIPEYEYLSDTEIKFTCSYVRDIDVFVCANLLGIYNAEANVGLFIDNPNNPECYHNIVVDFEPGYPIDARFYPCIKVDRDCVLRVYSDIVTSLKYPLTSRLLNYEEFYDVEDPYNTDNEYLSNLEQIDEAITGEMSDEDILSIYSRLLKYFYKSIEQFITMDDEQSNFTVCDNRSFGKEYFYEVDVNLHSGTKKFVMCRAPIEPYRDIILYEGEVIYDYHSHKIKKDMDGNWNESSNGKDTYLLPYTYDVDKVTLVKFNVNEDVRLVNIGEYYDVDLLTEFHASSFKYHRNMMILKSVYTSYTPTCTVSVNESEPKSLSGNNWFEIISKLDPVEVANDPIGALASEGLELSDLAPIMEDGNISPYMDSDDVDDYVDDALDSEFIPIVFGSTEPVNLTSSVVWYEFLDSIRGAVYYNDASTMVIGIDERLIRIKFTPDDVEAYVFDDIKLSFHDTLGVKYNSLLADLINCKVISNDDLFIFTNRLLTNKDTFDINLGRLYWRMSHTIATARFNDDRHSMILSRNINRKTFIFEESSELLHGHLIDLRSLDTAIIIPRSMVFINGRYIPYSNCSEPSPGYLQIDGFDEKIEILDILSGVQDEPLLSLKVASYSHWPTIDSAEPHVTLNEFTVQSTENCEHNYRGYYDILINEYIMNGALLRDLAYLEKNPEQKDSFISNLVQTFGNISDGERIVLMCNHSGNTPYQIT